MPKTLGRYIADAWNWFWFKATLKLKLIIIGLPLLLILGWWAMNAFSGWRTTRKIDKLKANINAATKDVVDAQANLLIDKQDVANKMVIANNATNQYILSVNATDAGRKELNGSLTNLANAVNAQRPANTTADDLNRRVEELDQ